MKDFDWEILYELRRNPNMTKAANLLYMTQPSLTKRLQKMEAEFQITIVNRTSKGLEFTAEGEYLAKRAELYLDFMKETRTKLAQIKENAEGTITIGSSYTYSKYTLSDVLFQYNQICPNVHFNVINEQSNLLFRKMLDGSIDVGFIRGDYEGPVKQVRIGCNQAYLVTKEPVSLADLPNLQRIEYKTNDRTDELLKGWWQDWFDRLPGPGMMVGYIDVAWQFIQKGLGYTCCFLPDHFDNRYQLCLTPLCYRDGSQVSRNTWFVYSQNKTKTKILEDFIRYITNELTLK